jgi:hypothetical protein
LNGATFARDALGFTPDEMQRLVLDTGAKRGLLNCTRQWGKSTVTAAKAVHRAATEAGSLVLVVSPSARQSGEFLKKAGGFVRRLGWKARGDGGVDPSLLLPNGSRIVGLPGVEATTRGFSGASLLLVDEAARVPDEVFEAIMPVLATSNGDLWLMSTPYGKRGFFYHEWEYGGAKWLRVSVPATECGRISGDFLESERERKGERLFRQEYLCAFVDTDEALVPGDVVEAAFDGSVNTLFGGGGGIARGRELFVGLDLGKRQDHSALAVVERVEEVRGRNALTLAWEREPRLRVVHMEEFRVGTLYGEVAQRVAELVRREEMRGRCEVVVDGTGVGSAVLEMLQGTLCPAAGRAAALLVPVVITGGEREGLSGSGGAYHVPKKSLMAAMAAPLESGELKIAGGVGCGEVLRKQLRDFRALPGGGGSGRQEHDDLVLALALACWRARKQPVGEVGKRLW